MPGIDQLKKVVVPVIYFCLILCVFLLSSLVYLSNLRDHHYNVSLVKISPLSNDSLSPVPVVYLGVYGSCTGSSNTREYTCIRIGAVETFNFDTLSNWEGSNTIADALQIPSFLAYSLAISACCPLGWAVAISLLLYFDYKEPKEEPLSWLLYAVWFLWLVGTLIWFSVRLWYGKAVSDVGPDATIGNAFDLMFSVGLVAFVPSLYITSLSITTRRQPKSPGPMDEFYQPEPEIPQQGQNSQDDLPLTEFDHNRQQTLTVHNLQDLLGMPPSAMVR